MPVWTALPWELLPSPLCILDLDTSGYLPRRDRVVEIAALRLDPNAPPRWLESRVDPNGGRFGGAPGFANLIPQLHDLMDGAVMVAHNAALDACFLGTELDRLGGRWGGPQLCTLELAHSLFPDRLSFSLTALTRDLCGEELARAASQGGPAQKVQATTALLGVMLRTAKPEHRVPETVRSLVRLPVLPTAWPRIVGSLLPPRRRELGADLLVNQR